MKEIDRYEYMIHQMQFLFPGIAERDTYEPYMGLQKFMESVLENQNIEATKEQYVKAMQYFHKKYAQVILKSLSI